MTEATITPIELKKAIEALTSPNYSHCNERVVGFIGIYHRTEKGINCAYTLSRKFCFLLEVFGKVSAFTPEFGLTY
jgi:hypothetical protein